MLPLLVGFPAAAVAPPVTVCAAGFPTCDHDTIDNALIAGAEYIEIVAATAGGFTYDGSLHAANVTIDGRSYAAIAGPAGPQGSLGAAINGGHLTLAGLEFTPAFGVRALRVIDSNLTVTSSTLFGVAPGQSGGHIYATGLTSSVTAESSSFRFGIAELGGSIAIEGGTLTLLGSNLFSANFASAGGAAIWTTDTDVVIEGPSTFEFGSTDGRGGHLGMLNGSLDVHCDPLEPLLCPTFQQGISSDFLFGAGGSVLLDGVSPAVIEGASILGSEAALGGGIAAYDTDLSLIDVLTQDNLVGAFGQGGGVLMESGTLDISGSQTLFLNNDGGFGGGAVHLAVATMTVDQGVFQNNTAVVGGAIVAGGATSTVTIDGATFAGNTADNDGGAIAIDGGSDLVVVNSTFEGDSTAGRGGAIIGLGAGTVTVSTSTFGSGPVLPADSPTTAAAGGAIALIDCGETTLLGIEVVGSLATGGSENDSGGAILIEDPIGSVVIEASTFTDTLAADPGSGGAIAVRSSTGQPLTQPVTLSGNVFTRTSTAGSGDGGAIFGSAVGEMRIDTSWFCDNSTLGAGIVAFEDGCGAGCAVTTSLFARSSGTTGGAIAAQGGFAGSSLTVDHVTGRDLDASTGGFVAADFATHLQFSHATYSGGPAVDIPTAGSSLTSVNLFSPGGYGTALASGPNPVDLTEVPPSWFPPESVTATGSVDPGACGIELRVQPQGNLGGRDLGAFEHPMVFDPAWRVDGDRDLSEWRYDCDDTFDRRSGEFGETCDDGIDNDCDGLVDGDDPDPGDLWVQDADGDGFPTETVVRSCDSPGPAWSLLDPNVVFDCDDNASDVYPGAQELCNNRDDDCDQVIDNGAPSGAAYGLDADLDGYVDGSSVTELCGEPPPGFIVAGELDCDDDDADTFPGAPEILDDQKDQNCDGVDAQTWLQGAGCTCASGSPGASPPSWVQRLLSATARRRP